MNDDTRALIGSGIRSVAVNFPFFSTLVQGWSEYEGNVFRNRVEAFFTEVGARLESLESLQAAHLGQLLSVEAQIALLEETVAATAREPQIEKRDAFARFYVSAITGNLGDDPDVVRSLLQELDSLTSSDLNILRRFEAQGWSSGDILTGTVNLMMGQSPYLQSKASDQEALLAPLHLSITKLETRGLIRSAARTKGGGLMYDGTNSPLDKFRHGFWELTYLGRQLLSAISQN